MALPNLYLRIDTDPNTPSVYTDVTSFTFDNGRQAMLDPFNAARAEATIRITASNTADINLIRPGMRARIRYNPSASSSRNFSMYVNDVNFEYSVAPNSDYCRVTFEGTMAYFTRTVLNSYALSAGNLSTQCTTLTTQSGKTIIFDGGVANEDPAMDAYTVTNVGDWIQQVLTTINGRMNDIGTVGGSPRVILLSKYYNQKFANIAGAYFVFTDGTVALGGGEIALAYDQYEVSSLGSNYYTQAIVDPASYPAQTAGTDNTRVLQLNTINGSALQAQDYANYLSNLFNTPTTRPAMISVHGQTTNADTIMDVMGEIVGHFVGVIFRGTRYTAVIEGVSYSATPSDSRWSFYLSGADLNNYLILDDAVYGVLDSNRLGY